MRHRLNFFRLLLTGLVCHLITVTTVFSQDYQLRIGIILPLSGDAASLGNSVKNGIELAIKDLDPKILTSLKIVYEDDALEPKNTVNAYQKLKQTGIDALITVSSGCSNAISPLVDRDQIPTLALATDPAVVKNRNWIVNLYTSDVAEAQLAYREASKRGYKKIARIMAIHDFMLAVKKSFDRANDSSISFPVDEEVNMQERDFKTIITKIRSKNDLDAVLLGVFPGQLSLLAKQLRNAGVTVPFFGFETMEDANEVKISEGALLNSWYVNSDDPNQDFVSRYSKTFPGQSIYGSANGFDAIGLLAKSAEAKLDREGINQMLHTLKDYQGALGTYSSTGDNRFTLAAAVKVVNEDGFEIVGR